MKVKAKWEYHKNEKFNLREVDTEYCCDDMRYENAIDFGEADSCGCNKNEHVNIYYCSPYPEGAVWDESPINLCPFCGEKIEVEIEDMRIEGGL